MMLKGLILTVITDVKDRIALIKIIAEGVYINGFGT
jgi:hypothetical protein